MYYHSSILLITSNWWEGMCHSEILILTVNFLFLVSVGVNFTEVVFSLQPDGLHNLHSVASPSRLVFFGSLHALVIFWPVLPSVMPFAACTKLDLGHYFLSTWVQLPGHYLSDIQDQKHENNLVWPNNFPPLYFTVWLNLTFHPPLL